MQTTISRNMVLIMILVFMAGCETFFEEDISQKTVEILSPSTGTITDIASQTFWWEKIDGAPDYHLQIVTPSFDSMEVLILDTLVSTDKFMMALYPSDYEWRVRAVNSAWNSQWATGSLTIYSTNDLTRQKINLQEPGALSNRKENLFKWEGLYNADHYTIVAFKERWDGVLAVRYTKVDTTCFESDLDDGFYIWGVKAANSTSESLYTQKSLMVDTSSPAVPVLLTPADKSTVSDLKVSFSWTSSDATSGVAQDTLHVFSDKELTKKVKSVVSTSKSAEIIFTDHTVYFWNVSSVDKAGNSKETASAFSFTIR